MALESLENRQLLTLLGIDLANVYPDIQILDPGSVNYSAGSQTFFFEATDITLQEGFNNNHPIDGATGSGSRLSDLKIIINHSGNLTSGVAGDDLVMMG